jgi:hypothetical protein
LDASIVMFLLTTNVGVSGQLSMSVCTAGSNLSETERPRRRGPGRANSRR